MWKWIFYRGRQTKQMGFKGYLSLQLKLIWVELGWTGAKVDQYCELCGKLFSYRGFIRFHLSCKHALDEKYCELFENISRLGFMFRLLVYPVYLLLTSVLRPRYYAKKSEVCKHENKWESIILYLQHHNTTK